MVNGKVDPNTQLRAELLKVFFLSTNLHSIILTHNIRLLLRYS